MRKRTTFIAVVLLIAAFATAPAFAQTFDSDLYCDGTYTSVDVRGNVYVEYGGICELEDATVEGNIHVMEGGSLALDGSYVDGNVQADGAWALTILNSTIAGDIQASYTAPSATWNTVEMNTVYGSIQLEKNWGSFAVVDNCVEGNVQIKDNYGPFSVTNTGEAACYGATVEGNVQTEGGSIDIQDAYIEGNVQTEGATDLSIESSEIYGDIQANYTAPSESPGSISGNTVHGNIQLVENWADFDIIQNYVYGNVETYENWGAVFLLDNIIMGNLISETLGTGMY